MTISRLQPDEKRRLHRKGRITITSGIAVRDRGFYSLLSCSQRNCPAFSVIMKPGASLIRESKYADTRPIPQPI